MILFALALAGATPAAAQIADLPVGTWSQASEGQELVLMPKVKLSPNVGVSMGTSLGGSAGFGSLTRTEIVGEPTVVDVAREMTLHLAADGDFTWVIVKRHADGPECTRTVRQEKHGRAQLAGSQLVFAITGGTEQFEKSCGGSGSSDLAAGEERYDLLQAAGEMKLQSGPAAWNFRPS